MLDSGKIKSLREKAGLTVADAARKAGLKSRQHWQGIESGTLPNPTLSTIESIADALGVKARDLLK